MIMIMILMMISIITMISMISMIDLNKSIVKFQLKPAVRAGSIRGRGRHHAGDQVHLDKGNNP